MIPKYDDHDCIRKPIRKPSFLYYCFLHYKADNSVSTVWRNAEWIAVTVACKTPNRTRGKKRESDGKTGQTRAYLGVSCSSAAIYITLKAALASAKKSLICLF